MVKNLMPGALAIAVGNIHNCAIAVDHAVWCWGYNGSGQLGDGTFTTPALGAVVMVKTLSGIDEIAAHGDFTCAHSMVDGSVSCWGAGGDGELGYGGYTSRGTPQKVSGLSNVAAVITGGIHACARRTDGAVACWGASYTGQIGDGTYGSKPAPATIPELTGVRDLACGDEHTCAVLGDGSVSCWGDGRAGELGNGISARRTPVAPLLPCP
jgi:alpha-tubulin suppressor-like RCC1 family protein